MALILPQNWCLIFFRDPETQLTSSRLKETLVERGITVTGNAEPFTVQCAGESTLSLSLQRGKFIEQVLRDLVGRSRKYAKMVPGCDVQIKIELSNVESVLDETNTLIAVQAALQDATQGLIYTSWNQIFSKAGD